MRRILVIEDSSSDAALLQAVLRDDPIGATFAVTLAETLAHGLEHAAAGSCDLVVLDLNLPDSNGYATFDRISRALPDVPIVVLTSYGSEDLARLAVENGAQELLHKDRLEPYWIARALQNAMARGDLLRRLKKAEAARRTFLASVSHEIKNPLGSLLMAIDVLQDEDLTAGERREFMDLVARTGKHLDGLIRDLLDLAKAEAGALRVELKALATPRAIEEAVMLLRPSFKAKQVTLTAHGVAGEAPTVMADPLRLRQIVTNLLSNALKATAPGGSVSVRVGASSTPDRVALDVEDDGAGIPADRVSRLFEAFYQADAGREGTGLGLALSRELARLQNGSVELVRTAPGAGSVFRLTLPRCAPHAKERSTARLHPELDAGIPEA